MTWKKHMWAAGIALAAFMVLSLLSSTWGAPMAYAMLAMMVVMTVAYLHYRRLSRHQRDPSAPGGQQPGALYALPGKDPMRMPNKATTMYVTVRDRGKCQIRNPGTCIAIGQVVDHIIPHSKGGSSRDPRNLQLSCKPCNLWKGAKILV